MAHIVSLNAISCSLRINQSNLSDLQVSKEYSEMETESIVSHRTGDVK